MRNFAPELLMALVLCLTLVLLTRTAPAEVAAPPPVLAQVRAAEPAAYDESATIRLLRGDRVETLPLSEYLAGVVMAEMPLSFEPAALEAQAIASRTYALHAARHGSAQVCDDSACCQAWADEAALRARLGEAYGTLREKARAAVAATDGQVLTYDGALIDATFFACSGGMTEDAVAVWGSDVPYLRAVASPGEEGAACYRTVSTFDEAEFAAIVRAEAPEAELEGDPAGWLGAVTRSAGGGVAQLWLGGVEFSGTQLRRLFGLRSTKFELHYASGCFRFETFGAGHRVGMSQYGAQAMALAGADAETILKAYYAGVELTRAEALPSAGDAGK